MRILYFLWTAFCMLLIAILLIFAFLGLVVLVWITPQHQRSRLYILPYYFAKICLFICGIRLKGIENIPVDFSQRYVFIFNHTSNLDPLISAVATRGKAKFLGKAEILRYPVFGYILKHLYISVDRYNANDRALSVYRLTRAIVEGDSVVIYPEGTRNNGPELLKPFHKGAFQISIDTDVPIVMLTCPDSVLRLPGNSWLLRPGTIHCVWDGPFSPAPYQAACDVQGYSAAVRSVMEARMRLAFPDGALQMPS